ncbi:hypothetical protein N7463_001451 [Penicillium fimorum]|uniref:F-box domain-containing protein n=1 Tax=Penicillium fimorum TaxID=1882269 RepID=A0A9W9Y7C8_9EURO|nr:hypothetical protein N7463_001451 [Penicillium fimorum]
MSIEVLPAEIFLLIVSFLPSESSIAALALSNRYLHAICNPYLYQNNVRHGNSSALYWAGQNGRIDTLQKALDAGAPLPKEQWNYPKRHFNFQQHPISLAAKRGHANIVRYMIDIGADSNIRDADCFTPVTVAALAGHAPVVEYLLDVGTQQHVEHEKYICFAAIHGHVDVVDIILSAPKQLGNPNLIMHRPKSLAPLTVAVRNGHEELAQMLVHKTESLHRTTALAFAVSQQNRQMAEMLLRSGVPPEFAVHDISDQYATATGTLPIGCTRYVVVVGAIPKPQGDGPDEVTVAYDVDFNLGDGDAVIGSVKSRTPSGPSAEIDLAISTTEDEAAVLITNSENATKIPLDVTYPITPSSTRTVTVKHPYFTFEVRDADGETIIFQWQIHPRQHGRLRYTLVRNPEESGSPDIQGVYYHLGLDDSFALPYSEGIMLLPARQGSEESVVVTSALAMLWRLRELHSGKGKVGKGKTDSKLKRLFGKK